jgi:hypothetical protein
MFKQDKTLLAILALAHGQPRSTNPSGDDFSFFGALFDGRTTHYPWMSYYLLDSWQTSGF